MSRSSSSPHFYHKSGNKRLESRMTPVFHMFLILHLVIPFVESGSAGKTFVQTFNFNRPDVEPTVKHVFMLATDSEDVCNVTITADTPPGTNIEIPVSKGNPIYREVPIKSTIGIKLEAPCDFVVHGINLATQSVDGWLAYPAEALGNEYIILGPEPWIAEPLQLTIVALNNGTECVVTFTNGTQRLVSLNATEVDYYTDPSDLSGSRVLCNDKITVLTGQRCSHVPAGCNGCDHTVEQVPPMNTLGRSFILAPVDITCSAIPICCKDQRFCNDCYDIYRVLALDNDTIVTRIGTVTNETITLRAGETSYVLQLQSEISSLISTKPLLVASLLTGSDYEGTHSGGKSSDPEFTYVAKVDSYVTHYQGITCLPGYNNLVNLLVPTGTGEKVLLNGFHFLNQSEAIQVPGMEFDLLRYRFDCSGGLPIPFTMEHTENKIFGMFVFGIGSFVSYGYWGAMILDVDPYFCRSAQINFTNLNIEIESCSLTRFKPTCETPTIWTDAECCKSNETGLTDMLVEVEFVPKRKRVWQCVWTLVDGCGKTVHATQTIIVHKMSKSKAAMHFLKGGGEVELCDEDYEAE